ncbi:hypothetical protein D3C72_919030 [compost metagenome]
MVAGADAAIIMTNSHPFTGDPHDRSDRGFHCRAARCARIGPHHSGRTGQGLSGPYRGLQRPRDQHQVERFGGTQSRCTERGRGLRCPPRPWRNPGAARRHPLHRQGQLSGQGADRRLRQPGLQGSGGPARCLYRGAAARRRCHLPWQNQYAAHGQWRHAARRLWPCREPL